MADTHIQTSPGYLPQILDCGAYNDIFHAATRIGDHLKLHCQMQKRMAALFILKTRGGRNLTQNALDGIA